MYDQPSPPPSHYEYTIKAAPIAKEQQVKALAMSAMKMLDGWCSDYKAATLMNFVWLIRPTTIVEIGVFGGKSLVPMAFALRATGQGKAYGIDPWSTDASTAYMEGRNLKYWGTLNHDSVLDRLRQKIIDFDLTNYISLIRNTSEDAEPIQNIDILHIDGNHSDECSYGDVIKWTPLVRSGGLIILDDITWHTMNRAPKWLDENCTRLLRVSDESNAWAVWVKP